LEKISGEIDPTKKDITEKLLLMLLDEGNFVIMNWLQVYRLTKVL